MSGLESGTKKPLVIAIDGPAGSGKSTVAQRVADELGYLYIDTGAMYRAATWLVMNQNINPQDLETIVKLISHADIHLQRDHSLPGSKLQVFVNGEEIT